LVTVMRGSKGSITTSMAVVLLSRARWSAAFTKISSKIFHVPVPREYISHFADSEVANH
jgi:hypothetical protein